MLRCGDHVGTAFAYDRDGRQYIVTAKHLVAEFGPKTPLHALHDKSWKALPAKLVGHGAEGCDVSVFAAEEFAVRVEGELFSNDRNIIYGQEVHFLGFPLGMFGDIGELLGHFPLPYVKRAILSSMTMDGSGVMVLDGINNPGFSGGPIIGKVGAVGALAILGVVSGYTAADSNVLFKDKDTGLIVRENTGLIRAFHIVKALDLIDANPVGQRL